MTNCYVCDSALYLKREDRELSMGSRSVTVQHEFYCCSSCGEEYLLPEQMAMIQQRASTRIREEEGLLQSADILRIRTGLRLTQDQFERLLGVGPKTVVRWERGSVFQSKAADNLMRLTGAIPDAATYLARRNGVELPAQALATPAWSDLASFMNVVAVTPYLNFGGSGGIWNAAEVRVEFEAVTAPTRTHDRQEPPLWTLTQEATVRMPLKGGNVAGHR